jgi:thiol:disulfide interchange protein DsbC
MKPRFLLLCASLLPLMACGDSVGAATDSAAATHAAPQAAPVPAQELAADDPRVALAAKIPGAKPEDLRATPVTGVYELVHGADISYITVDAKYVFSGDLFQITTRGDFPNLSESRRKELRLEKLAAIPESEMLVFGPATAKHTITVFTDVDCPWCRKLHQQIADYNRLGIRVRYLFFPRSGPDTESWYKAEAVWCAKDRNKALTLAKEDKPIDMKRCPDAPVKRDYELGHQLGVTGTPGIVLENGELVPGYLGPQDLLTHIKNSLAAAQQSN